MINYEQLMQEAINGNKSAYKDLYSNAGSGNAEAQYYLAIYYKEVKGVGLDSDYAYWMKKAKDNGYDVAQDFAIPESNLKESDDAKESSTVKADDSLKKLLMKFSFMGRINRTEYIISIIGAILLILTVSNVEEPVTRSILNLTIDVFWWSQCARRLHDFGASGWYVLIPVVSWVFAAFPKGDKEENEYGKAPA